MGVRLGGARDLGMAMAHSAYYDGMEAMQVVLQSLREDRSIPELRVRVGEESMSLQDFLVDAPYSGEIQAFFLGAPYFNIFETLPVGLQSYQDQLKVSHEEAPRLLERFNDYTFSRNPEARDLYYRALRMVKNVANCQYEISDNPELSSCLDDLLALRGFGACPSSSLLKTTMKRIQKIESEYQHLPHVPFWNIFTQDAREKRKNRDETVKDLSPRLKGEAQKTLDVLKSLGYEYRKFYISGVEEFWDEELDETSYQELLTSFM